MLGLEPTIAAVFENVGVVTKNPLYMKRNERLNSPAREAGALLCFTGLCECKFAILRSIDRRIVLEVLRRRTV